MVHIHLVPGPGAGIRGRWVAAGSEGHGRTEAVGMVRGIRPGVEERERRNDHPVWERPAGERHSGLVVVEGHHSGLVVVEGHHSDLVVVEGHHSDLAEEGDIGLGEERHKAETDEVADSPGADHLEALAADILRREVLMSWLVFLCQG